MLHKSVRNSLVILSLLLSLTGCVSLRAHINRIPIRPQAPEQLPAIPNPIAPAKDSVISFPVHADLSPFLNLANDENVIPKKFDHWGSYIKSPKGVDYKFYAERDDFAMKLSAPNASVSTADSAAFPFLSLPPDLPSIPNVSISTADRGGLRDWWKGLDLSAYNVSISAALRYKMGANPQLHIDGSPVLCGDGAEWPRRAMLNGNVAIGMMPNYGLAAFVSGVTFNTIDPCRITVADIDVTPEVKKKLADIVAGGLNNAVPRINALTVKTQVEEAWSALRKPIQLESDAWLLLNIDKVRHSGFSGSGQVVNDTIQIIAKPIVVLGAEPPSTATALPQLETQPSPGGFHIVADAQLDYVPLSNMLAKRLKGKLVYNVGTVNESIVITNASISGNGGNQVVVRVDFVGDEIGHVYFVGTPKLNQLTQSIYIGDLHYDLASETFLQKAAGWLYSSPLRALVAAEASFGVTPATDHVRKLIAPALNRTLSPAVSMHGTVALVEGIDVFAGVDALHVLAMAEGTLNLVVAGKP